MKSENELLVNRFENKSQIVICFNLVMSMDEILYVVTIHNFKPVTVNDYTKWTLVVMFPLLKIDLENIGNEKGKCI